MMQNARTEDDTLPRYHRVGNELQRRIEDGTYPVGASLPTESELCAEFNVSRYTVREALRRLTDNGLLQRRQGSGSQVIARETQTAFVQSMRSISGLFQFAKDTRFDVMSVESIRNNDELVGFLGGEPRRPWLKVDAVRREPDGGASICFTRVFINGEFADLAPKLPDQDGPFYSLIESEYGETVTIVWQDITAEPMAPDVARVLDCAPDIWAVRVVRRYIGEHDKQLQISINYHPADRFTYSMQMRREELRGES